jgi:RNA polymerase sigma-70 factor (ECF subfamily)
VAPLRPDLRPEVLALAGETRLLIVSLESATRDASGWRDGPASGRFARWLSHGRDPEYAPTIGMTGEVWRWLQAAERIADADDPNAERIAFLARSVRDALFRKGPVLARVHEILAQLIRFDDGMRAHEGGAYRDAAVAPPAAALQRDDETETERTRRRRFATVLDEHGRALRGIATRYADDDAAREDLHQDIQLAVWRALPKFRGDASLKTYVLRIAHYCGARFSRRQFRVTGEPAVEIDGPHAEAWLDDGRRRAQLAEAIEGLPCGQRSALTLLLQGLSYREIAHRLEIGESAVSVRITRARQSLRRRLGEPDPVH